MRRRCHVRVGQVWQLSDPRRLSAFRIFDTTYLDEYAFVYVVQLYPQAGQMRTLAAEKFWQTGPKGYTRVS